MRPHPAGARLPFAGDDAPSPGPLQALTGSPVRIVADVPASAIVALGAARRDPIEPEVH